jgi:hypothetical protein
VLGERDKDLIASRRLFCSMMFCCQAINLDSTLGRNLRNADLRLANGQGRVLTPEESHFIILPSSRR